MLFLAGDEALEVLQLREEALHFPAAAVPAELPGVLGDAPTCRSMRRDELNAAFGQRGIQRIGFVPAVADYVGGELADEPMLQRIVDKRAFAGNCTCDGSGERKTSTVCECHDLGAFPFAGQPDGEAPFFAPAKVASMNASVKSLSPANWWRTRARVPSRTQR